MKSNPRQTEHIKGTVVFRSLEGGMWVLVDPSGLEYQLIDPPSALRKNGLRVTVEGYLQEDIVTIGMAGIPLKVESFLLEN